MSFWLAKTVFLTTLMAVVATFFMVPEGEDTSFLGIAQYVSVVWLVLSFSCVGFLIARRGKQMVIGSTMLWLGWAWAIACLATAYQESHVHSAPIPPAGKILIWAGGWFWMAGLGPAGTFLILLFPNGQLISRRWRIVAAGAAIGMVAVAGALALAPGDIQDTQLDNPVGLPGAAKPVLSMVGAAGGGLLFIAVLVSLSSIPLRYWKAPPTQRMQLRWLVYAVGIVALFITTGLIVEGIVGGDNGAEIANLMVSGSFSLIPAAIGIAILRHRLYDIDVVINRTLVYGLLTAILVGTYLVIVVVLQQLLAGIASGSDLAVPASTLAVAALLRPLRSRVQVFIDRRFYRRKYDAAATIEAFAGHLRDEVDLTTLRAELVRLVEETMQPQHASVWLREPAATRPR